MSRLGLPRRGDRGLPMPLLLVDGPAGSGKTTFAEAVTRRFDSSDLPTVFRLAARRLPMLQLWRGGQLLSMDEFYPGWGGLQQGQRMLVEDLLVPLSQGRPLTLRRWDWQRSRPAGLIEVSRSVPLVVEGCGALTARSRRFADFSVWVQANGEVRRQRALERDGALFAAHWDRWLSQERGHWQDNDPQSLADATIDVN